MPKESLKSDGDEGLDFKINIEQCVQAQIIHLSSESEHQGIKRPGAFSNGRRTNSRLVFPIIYIGDQESSSPLVLGIVMTGLSGKSVIFGYSLLELNVEIQGEITKLLEFEGFPAKSHFLLQKFNLPTSKFLPNNLKRLKPKQTQQKKNI